MITRINVVEEVWPGQRAGLRTGRLEMWVDGEKQTYPIEIGRITVESERFEEVRAAISRNRRGHPRFFELLDELADTHIRKNAGYAGIDNPDPLANFRESERFGVSAFKGCLVRVSDKFIRITNLVRSKLNEQVGETLEDTLIDLAAYCLIAIILSEEEKS